MKKIIEEGRKVFVVRCPQCGCKYSYEVSDILGNGTNCPECDAYVVHPRQDYDIEDKSLKRLCESVGSKE